MQKLSVVIICKNSAGVIEKTLQSFSGLTDEIVVYDNGSTDGTQEIVQQCGANLFNGIWEGYIKTKNKANGLAKYDWILSIDSDEAIDGDLKQSLSELLLNDEKIVYELLFKNFVGSRYLKYGEWGRDRHIRLFNRNLVKWKDDAVHEQLIIPDFMQVKRLKGYVLHYTTTDFQEYENKTIRYAELNAEKYLKQGKKVWPGKQWISSVFSFLQNYIFRLGFLDGRDGYHCARINARYTFLKYAKLKELKRQLATGNKQETP